MMAYMGLPLDIFGKVWSLRAPHAILMLIHAWFIFDYVGRILPTLPTFATVGYAEGQ
jgi:hypothetical protein